MLWWSHVCFHLVDELLYLRVVKCGAADMGIVPCLVNVVRGRREAEARGAKQPYCC